MNIDNKKIINLKLENNDRTLDFSDFQSKILNLI